MAKIRIEGMNGDHPYTVEVECSDDLIVNFPDMFENLLKPALRAWGFADDTIDGKDTD